MKFFFFFFFEFVVLAFFHKQPSYLFFVEEFPLKVVKTLPEFLHAKRLSEFDTNALFLICLLFSIWQMMCFRPAIDEHKATNIQNFKQLGFLSKT
jgi:hypothetical protein